MDSKRERRSFTLRQENRRDVDSAIEASARPSPSAESMDPLVSVVLPVYNCAHYVGQAIQSILDQTFTDFELIVIDDGSTDSTPNVLQQYADPRIRQSRQENIGLAATLNRGIELARGRYVARQDQDDISLPGRLAKQVAYLDSRPTCALLGTWAEIWREHARTERVHRHPPENSILKFELLFNNPFVHSSVMLRKSALDRVGGYSTDSTRQPPEDYELWSRIAREYDVGNIPEILHVYRETGGSMSRVGPSPFLDHLVTLCAENIAWAAGTDSTDPAVANLAALVHNADHRLVGRPDFNAIRATLRGAVERLGVVDDRASLQHAADRRVRSLSYRYFQGWVLRRARKIVAGLNLR
jgi:glycosyltransferase involved in cell wall biosynthesis